ncbi:MAG: sulfatase-like hydrolase/transferase [Puniceicoccaceae bacterium]
MGGRPNIIFIFTDDQRIDTISALGCEEIETPNLDRLVEMGTSFTQAHIMGGTHVAVCMPSRAMLLTGRSLFSLDCQGQRIPPEHITFPELFRQHGYKTCHVGKWHQDVESHGRAFDTARKIFGFRNLGWYEACNGHWHTPVFDHDPTGQYEQDTYYHDPPLEDYKRPFETTKEEGRHSAEVFTDAAIEFIREQKDGEPYLLYLAHLAPHDPRQYPAKLASRYNTETVSLPENFMTTHPFDNGEMYARDELLEAMPRRPEAVNQHLADYYAIISHVDEQVGRILDELEQSGEINNTIIIFAGDNGLACGQHGLMGKQNLYEHSIRVPLILSGPGIPCNVRRDASCYLSDIFPTLCELLEIDCPDTVEGKSLVPALTDSSEKIRECLHFAYRGVQRSIKQDQMKLIEYVVDGKRATQLFDLSSDPLELTNLADEPHMGETIKELRLELQRWQNDFNDTGIAGESFWSSFNNQEKLGPWKPGSHALA